MCGQYRYSCDEGMSWNEYYFSTTPLVVLNIHTEPGKTSTEVVLVL